MANYLISKRIQKILQFIKDKYFPSKEAILDYLERHDLTTSIRTFERDLKNIRTEFGIEITYCSQQKGYYINEEESTDIEAFFKYLELVSLSEVFSDGLQGDKELMKYVKFDDSSSLKGVENLDPILKAIKQGCQLSFKHHHYYRGTTKGYTITPLLIKEYLNRWYVIGVPDGLETIRTFGVDRLSDLSKGALITLDTRKFQHQIDQFDQIVGVRVNNSKLEHIVLKTDAPNMKYFKSLPLHPSQSIIPDKETGFYQVCYDIIPNYEFDIQILKKSMEVEVIAPEWYRNHIKYKIEKIYNKYQNS